MLLMKVIINWFFGRTGISSVSFPVCRLDELNSEGGNIELSVSDVDDVLTIIKDDYEREYFVTGTNLYSSLVVLYI